MIEFNAYISIGEDFSPTINIIGRADVESLQDLSVQLSEKEIDQFIGSLVRESVEERTKMDVEDMDIEKEWSKYKRMLSGSCINPKLTKLFEDLGLITIETDMGGNYVKLTEKGINTN